MEKDKPIKSMSLGKGQHRARKIPKTDTLFYSTAEEWAAQILDRVDSFLRDIYSTKGVTVDER